MRARLLVKGVGRDSTASGAFSTTFPNNETPVSQSGTFTHGTQQAGTSATGPSSTTGKAFAPNADGLDYVATVQGQFTANKHYSEVTINFDAAYTAPDTHEIEIHVGTTIASNSAQGYEFDLWFGGGTMQAIRWDDPAGGFDTGACTTVSGAWSVGSVVDGDVIRVDYDSTSGSPVMTVKLNGVTQWVVTDTTAGKHTSGSPGFAFFVRTGGTPNRYCIKRFACGSLP